MSVTGIIISVGIIGYIGGMILGWVIGSEVVKSRVKNQSLESKTAHPLDARQGAIIKNGKFVR